MGTLDPEKDVDPTVPVKKMVTPGLDTAAIKKAIPGLADIGPGRFAEKNIVKPQASSAPGLSLSPSSDNFILGDTTAGDIARAAYDVPVQLGGAVAGFVEGREDPMAEMDWKDEAIEKANLRNKRRHEFQFRKDNRFREEVRKLPANLAFSGVSAALGIGAGMGAAAVTGPVGGYGAGMGAAGLGAYRMEANMFGRELYNAANEDYMAQHDGIEIPQEVWAERFQKLQPLITADALAEAVPEAVGSAIGFKILRGPSTAIAEKILGKGVMDKVKANLGKYATGVTGAMFKGASMFAEEEATEVVTQMLQHNIAIDAGLADGPKRSWMSAEDIWESAKEVAPQVAMLTAVMGGGGALVNRSYKKNVEDPKFIGDLNAAIDSGKISAMPLKAMDSTIEFAEEMLPRHKKDAQFRTSLDVLKAAAERKRGEFAAAGKPGYGPQPAPSPVQAPPATPPPGTPPPGPAPPGSPPGTPPAAPTTPPPATPAPETPPAAAATEPVPANFKKPKGLLGKAPREGMEAADAAIAAGEYDKLETIAKSLDETAKTAKSDGIRKQAADIAAQIRAVKVPEQAQKPEGATTPATAQEGTPTATSPAEDTTTAEKIPPKKEEPLGDTATFSPTHELPDGTKVVPNTEDGEAVAGEWQDSDGNIIEDKNGAPMDEPTAQVAQDQAAIDAAANEAATSPKNDKPEPTEEEAKNDDYDKGEIPKDLVNGFEIEIENPKGSIRKGKDEDGKAWEHEMTNHYGYFKGKEGFDGDDVDVNVGEFAADPSLDVYVVNQVNPKTGEFDEHKIQYGFKSEQEAKEGYLSNYDKGWQGLGSVDRLNQDEFQKKLDSGYFKNSTMERQAKVPPKEEKAGIGVNADGQTIYEDENGVRYITEKGVNIQQKVELRPTRSGYESVPVEEDRFNPVEPKAAKPEPVPDRVEPAESGIGYKITKTTAEGKEYDTYAITEADIPARKEQLWNRHKDDMRDRLKDNADYLANAEKDFLDTKGYAGRWEKGFDAGLRSEGDSKADYAPYDIGYMTGEMAAQGLRAGEGMVVPEGTAKPTKAPPKDILIPKHASAFGYSRKDSDKHPKSPNWKLKEREVVTVSSNKHGVPQEDYRLGQGKNGKWGFSYSFNEGSLGDGYGLFTKFTKAYDSKEEAIAAMLDKVEQKGGDVVRKRFEAAVKRGTGKLAPKKPAAKKPQAKKPAAKPKKPPVKVDSAAAKKAQDDLDAALGDLGDIFTDKFTEQMMPIDEAKLMPVLTRILDAAFRLGYHKFKDAAKYTLDVIREKFGDNAANSITLDHIQGAYIGMAGKYDTADTKKAVIDVETIEEITATLDTEAENENQPETENLDTQGTGGPKDGPRIRPDDTGGGRDGGGVEGEQPVDVPGTGGTKAGEKAGSGVSGENLGGQGESGTGRPGTNGREGTSGEELVSGTGGTGTGEGVTAGSTGSSNERPVGDTALPVTGNFHVENPLEVVGGGQVARFNKNKEAIELYLDLQAEGKQPTREQQKILAGYTGWGSFGQELFQGYWGTPQPKDGWQERDTWLRTHLGKEEWESAQRSITNSHYTDPPTIMAIWNMVRKMGFTGGRVLEPAMGIGNFFGMMPIDMKKVSSLTGIELDKLTGGMAKMLYPDANISIKGYQDSKTPDNFYDLVIGNWPFENTHIADRRYNKLNPLLHDYFFLKALDQVRPGGLVVAITSKGTLDKLDKNIRIALAKKAEFVTAFRLPSGAFKEYAGTSVVTDIIILKKRPAKIGILQKMDNWIKSLPWETSQKPVNINEFYHENPSNVIGTIDYGHGTTFGRPGMIVNRPDNMEDELERISNAVPEGTYVESDQTEHIKYITNHTDDRQGSLIRNETGLFVVRGEHLVLAADVRKWEVKAANTNKVRLNQLTKLINMRRLYARLIESEGSGDTEVTEAARTELKSAYDRFKNIHGTLRESFGLKYLKQIDDPFYTTLAALEVNTGTKLSPVWAESLILTESTSRPRQEIENPTISDAFVIARNSHVIPSLKHIADIAGKSEEEVKANLLKSGAVFEVLGGIEPKDVYLSGNVRQKLRDVKSLVAEGHTELEPNIAALEAVVPEDIPYHKIEARFGNTWINHDVYKAYIAHMLNLSEADKNRINIAFTTGRWKIKFPLSFQHKAEAVADYGTSHVRFKRLVNAAVSNQSITIKYKDDDGVTHVDEKATKEVTARIAKIRDDFSEWVWQDPERQIELEREYNEVRNSWADPVFDGSFMSFEGMALQFGNQPFNLRQHQADAIWRGIVNRRSINAHEVGTGKTFTIGGIAIESRRYGIARKPLILAHNANSASVAIEIQEMYPAAKVLYIDNLSPKTIGIRLRQIANDDWDAIVMPHSLIDRLALTEETLMGMAAEEIASLEAEAREAADDDGVAIDPLIFTEPDSEAAKTSLRRLRSTTAKELVKARNKIIENIKKSAQRATRADSIPFEELGIDMVMVDEVHEFKKPTIVTKMRMKGLNTQVSNRSLSLQFLTRYIRAQNDGKNVHTFSGTPITNTLSEIYHQMRFIMEEDMSDLGVDYWDGWFNSFASEVADVELNAAAEYESVTRLAAFINVPELRKMIGQYMDVVFSDTMPEMQPRSVNGKTMADKDLTEAERAELENGRTEGASDRPYKKIITDISDMTPPQVSAFHDIQTYARQWRAMTGMEKREAMMEGARQLPIIYEGLASKASIDARLLHGTDIAGQEGEVEDDPNSKASRVVKNVTEIYNSDSRTTQVIFSEIGIGTRVSRSVGPVGEKTKVTEPNFSTAKDIIERLVKNGIPREQIALITGSTSKIRRKEISEAMNKMEIRVVIGNSKTLGVGVNMQKNLRALHHIDAPWTPGDLEQRNGRGHRQGNQWNTVLEYRYITDRLDGRRWQILSIKDRFIKAFLQANTDERTIEGDAAADEQSDILETFAEAAGDPRILLKEKAKKKIERFQGKERMHTMAVADAKNKVRNLKSSIEYEQGRLVEHKKVDKIASALLEENTGDKFNAVINGKEYKSRQEVDNAIAQFITDNVRNDGTRHQLGEIAGAKVLATWPKLAPEAHIIIGIDDGTNELVEFATGRANIQSVMGTLRATAGRVTRTEERIAENEKSMERMKSVSKESFAQADKLAMAEQELKDLEADMDANPVPPPSWLRQGAPVDTAAFWKGKEFIVTGHRWTSDGWFVVAQDEKGSVNVPYLEVTDNQGIQLYEERDFERPVVITGIDPDVQERMKEGTRVKVLMPMVGNTMDIPNYSEGTVVGKMTKDDNDNHMVNVKFDVGDTIDGIPLAMLSPESEWTKLDTSFSRKPGEPAKEPLPFDTVESHVREIESGLGLSKNIKVEVYKTESELPQKVKDQAEKEGATGKVVAVHIGDTIYIVADRHTSRAQVEESMLHESMHYARDRIKGMERAYTGLWFKLGGVNGIKKWAAELGIDMSEYIDTADKLMKEGKITSEQRAIYLVDEFLAMAKGKTAYEQLPVRIKRAFSEFWGRIKELMRKWNLPGLAEFTDADLANVLKQVHQAARDGTSVKAGTGTASFNVGQVKQLKTNAFKKWFGDSKVVDDKGEPLVLYRGEHGKEDRTLNNRLPTYTPNKYIAGDYAADGEYARVGLYYMRMEKPVDLDNGEDVISIKSLKKLLGPLKKGEQKLLEAMVLKPNNWRGWDDSPLENATIDYGTGDPYTVPLDKIPDDGYTDTFEIADTPEFVQLMKNRGYDGIIIRGPFNPTDAAGVIPEEMNDLDVEGEVEYRVFTPNQVKSVTGNNGKYSRESDNISFSRSPKYANYSPDIEEAKKKGQFGADTKGKGLKAALGRARNAVEEGQQVWKSRMRQGMLDQYDSIRTVLQDPRSWMMANLSHSGGGAVEAMLKYGQIKLDPSGAIDIDIDKKSLAEILEPLGDEVADFLQWIAGNRANNLKKAGKENRFTQGEIDALMSLNDSARISGTALDGKDREAIYNGILKEFNEIADAVTQIGIDTDTISAEEAEVWQEEGFYVPFYRVLEKIGSENGGFMSVSGLSNQTPYKNLKGADLPLNDLLSNVVMNWNHIISASLKNQAARETIATAVEFELAKPVNPKFHSKQAIFIREGGVKKWYELDSSPEGQLVLDSLMSLNWRGLDGFSMKAARKFKRALTIGVTANPEFKVANLLRDSIQAIAVAKMDVNVIKNIKQGWKATGKNSPAIMRMIAGGGAFGDSGYVHGSEQEAMKRVVDKDVHYLDRIIDSPGKVKKMWDWWSDMGAKMENVNRAANFEQDISDVDKKGNTKVPIDLLTANFNARDHLDFMRTGSFIAVRALTQTVPFLNARMQGLDKIFRSGASKTQKRQMFTVMAVYSAAAVLMYWMMKDDEDYKAAPQWERDTYHLFKVPGSDLMFRIPRPFEVGLMATIAERAAEQWFDDEVHGGLFWDRLAHGLTETLAFNPIPQIFSPAIEVAANKSNFTKRPIEGQGMQNLSSVNRKRAWTSDTAIGMSHAMDAVLWEKAVLSPIQVEHLVKGYLGWLGGFTLASSDFIYGGLSNAPAKPTRQIQDYVAIGRFARRGPSWSTQYTTQFYENLQEANRAYADIRDARLEKNLSKVESLIEESGQKVRWRKTYNKYQRELSVIGKELSATNEDPDMTSAAKRKRIDTLLTRKARITQSIVKRSNADFR